MPRSTLVLAALLALAPALEAQSPDHPNLVLSIQGGLMADGGNLWAIRQLESVQQPAPNGVGWDTLALGRRITAGLTALVSGTYFRSPRLGYTVEIGYLGFGGEGTCSVIGTYKTSTAANEQPNRLACEATDRSSFDNNVVALQAGVTYRLLPAAAVAPYARITAGVGALGNSYIDTSPTIVADSTCASFVGHSCPYTLLNDPHRASITWVATLAIGNTFQLSPAYNIRLEVRDNIASLPFASDSGTVGGTPTPRSGWRLRHAFGLTVGLDVVLEHSHRRRY